MKRLSALAAALLCALVGAGTALAAPADDGALKVVQKIPGPDGGWDYVSFDAARHRVYFSHGTQVLSLDVVTGKLNPSFAAGNRLHSIAVVPGSSRLVTTNSGDNSVRILNAADGALIKSLTVAEDADGAVYDPVTRLVVVVNGDPSLLTLIDAKRETVAGTIKVGDKLEFLAVDGKGKAYVNVVATGEVAVVDLVGRKTLTRFKMTACKRPTGIAYVTGARLVVACGEGAAEILDAASGKELATFKVGGFPDSVLFDPVRRLAFVPSALDGKLNVIALSGKADNTMIAQVPTQIGARVGAVDPKTGRVYLPSAEYLPAAAPGQRPTTKPGTFNVLVLDR
jgi:DNA-binding beta-propeller fold protein YncE